MIFISVTRARLRSIRFLPAFAFHALRSTAQVRRAAGFKQVSFLPDKGWSFWTMTAWQDEASMRAYMSSGAHRTAMPGMLRWCDEASVVHWTQDDDALPTWAEAEQRMRKTGRPSTLRYPSPDHATMTYAPPVRKGSPPLGPLS